MFTKRVSLVVKNIVHQLASVHSPRQASQCIDPQNVHFESVFTALGRALTILVTLDEIIKNNDLLLEHWTLYKRMMKSVRNATEVFGLQRDQLQPFEIWVLQLEGELLDGNIFQNCISQKFDDMTVGVTANTTFRDEFTISLRLMHAYLEQRLGQPNERTQRHDFIGLVALFVFHHQLFRVVDKKLTKALWDVQHKVPVITLYGSALFIPNEFIGEKMPQVLPLVQGKGPDLRSVRLTRLQEMDRNITDVAQAHYMDVSRWMIRMEDREPMGIRDIGQKKMQVCTYILKGVLSAYHISNFVKTFLMLHSELEVPMRRSQVCAMFRLLELLKAIQQVGDVKLQCDRWWHSRACSLPLTLTLRHFPCAISLPLCPDTDVPSPEHVDRIPNIAHPAAPLIHRGQPCQRLDKERGQKRHRKRS